MRRKTRTKGARAMQAAALHWTTHYGHVHGHVPSPADAGTRNIEALRDIVLVQCHGDTDRACALIEEIVRAPLIATLLGFRYVEFWTWIAKGSPRRFEGYDFHDIDTVRGCIALNARVVA